jgi:hypothetical protein
MTVDQSSNPVAVDRDEASSRFGWLSAGEIGGSPSGEPEERADAVPGPLMPPAFPIWPRVYPGL